MRNRLTSIEICAGAGGQALGLEQAGFHHQAARARPQCVCDLRINRPYWNTIQDDVTQWRATRYRGEVDLFAGGVPCPPFSKAGRQLGANDERDLFPTAIRLIRECQPKAVLLENVRGLLDRAFDDYREKLDIQLRQEGYRPFWKLHQAADFGVPQLRPRAILVALKEELARHFDWPRPSRLGPPTVGEALGDMMAAGGWEGAHEWAAGADKIAPTLVGGSTKHGGPDLGPTRARAEWSKLGVNGKLVARSLRRLGLRDALPHSRDGCGRQGFPCDGDLRVLGRMPIARSAMRSRRRSHAPSEPRLPKRFAQLSSLSLSRQSRLPRKPPRLLNLLPPDSYELTRLKLSYQAREIYRLLYDTRESPLTMREIRQRLAPIGTQEQLDRRRRELNRYFVIERVRAASRLGIAWSAVKPQSPDASAGSQNVYALPSYATAGARCAVGRHSRTVFAYRWITRSRGSGVALMRSTTCSRSAKSAIEERRTSLRATTSSPTRFVLRSITTASTSGSANCSRRSLISLCEAICWRWSRVRPGTTRRTGRKGSVSSERSAGRSRRAADARKDESVRTTGSFVREPWPDGNIRREITRRESERRR